MMKRSIRTLALAMLLPACSSAEESGTSNTDSEGSDTSSTGTPTASDTASGSASMTGASASSTSATTTTSGSTTDDESSTGGGFINPESGGETGPVGPQPNGAECANNDQCESGFCYMVPMVGGVCSECLTDADCEFTCSLDAAAGYAACSDGSTGVMCESSDGCADGLVCAELLDTGGIFPANFCSECETNAECDDGQTCTPTYDFEMIGGYLSCADAMSVPDAQGCPIVDGMGDGTVCQNGHCGVADVFGVLEIGLCGECTTAADCADGEECMPAMAGMGGLAGPTCG